MVRVEASYNQGLSAVLFQQSAPRPYTGPFTLSIMSCKPEVHSLEYWYDRWAAQARRLDPETQSPAEALPQKRFTMWDFAGMEWVAEVFLQAVA